MQSSVNHLTADFNRNDSDGMHTLQSTIFGGFGFFFFPQCNVQYVLMTDITIPRIHANDTRSYKLLMDKHNESWEQICNFGSTYATQHFITGSVTFCSPVAPFKPQIFNSSNRKKVSRKREATQMMNGTTMKHLLRCTIDGK